MESIMNIFKKILEKFKAWRNRRARKKMIEKLKKQDPFIY